MLIWSDTLYVVVAALAFDALIGDPDWLWRRLPHPVALIGSFIGVLDRSLNLDAVRASLEEAAAVLAEMTDVDAPNGGTRVSDTAG